MQEAVLTSPFELRLSDGGLIRGDIRVTAAGGSRPAVLIAHGFKGFKDWGFFPYAAEQLARAGFYTITFNFSRNGVSGSQEFDELGKFGLNTYSREQADLERVIAALIRKELPHQEKADPKRLGLIGHSRGGGNALLFAAEHPLVRAAVSWNGIARANLFEAAFEEEARREGVAFTPNARTGQQMPIRKEFFEDLDANAERFDIPARLASLRIPVLLIQGDQDSPRLLEAFRILKDAAQNGTSLLLEGAGHTFGTVHPFAGTTASLESGLEATIEFLRQKI
ncbi:alpha/beta hydrolase [Paenibacillus pasadenensis]|uniref:alpha/beta hydrolase family protein n=1 Tax=Paenibacillus pasadenensis TaxID=217090 RepID=UPI00203E3099|nr:alpha/beta fold hydrolase [Paenibacillus pasadenensis]MCM3748504.1 alpha/beta hydrolase [Paenibacillus pasadenensis]